MKKVTIYSTTYCPYCNRAKDLLTSKNIEFTEIDLTGKDNELLKLVERTKMRTVPQIFFNDELIGGFDELNALEQVGQLENKLA